MHSLRWISQFGLTIVKRRTTGYYFDERPFAWRASRSSALSTCFWILPGMGDLASKRFTDTSRVGGEGGGGRVTEKRCASEGS